MGIEAATHISNLVATNPTGSDDYATADDHLRLIKTVLQAQFPNFTAVALLASVAELDTMDGITSTTAELNKLDGFTGLVADLNILAGAAAGGLTDTELLFLNGVTSAIQTQINGKAPSAHSHTSGEISALDVSDITTGIFATSFIPNLAASKITSGVFAAARIPTHTGDVTGQTALTIVANAVSLAKMADMATASFIGRNTAATGDPEILSATVARAILNVENGSTADQTAGQIEAIVNHDNLLGFLANEHLDWTADLGGTNLHVNNAANQVLALTSGEVTQLANIGTNLISAAEWATVAGSSGINTGDEPDASSSVKGIVERATQAEVDAGTEANMFVTPLTLASASTVTNILTAVKAANNTPVQNSTFINDSDLAVTVVAGKRYAIEMMLEIQTPTTADFKWQFTIPGAATGFYCQERYEVDVTGALSDADDAIDTNSQFVSHITGANMIVHVHGVAHCPSAGTFQLQWAQNTTTAVDTFTKEESYLKLTQLD